MLWPSCTGLIKRYSEFINFPIYLYTTKEEEEEVPVEEGDDSSSDDEEEEEVRLLAVLARITPRGAAPPQHQICADECLSMPSRCRSRCVRVVPLAGGGVLR